MSLPSRHVPTRSHASHRPRRPGTALVRGAAGGFVIIEALIALLIFSIGALGLIGLQVTMMRANSSAKFRADAAFLASDLIGTLWTDAPNLASYTTAGCSGYTRCQSWSTRVSASLPAGTYTLTPDTTTGLISIQIQWTVPKEGTHKYTTSASINP